MDGDADQEVGRPEGHGLFPEALGDEARRAQGPRPPGGAGRGGRSAGRTHHVQQQHRVVEAQGGADRFRPRAAGRRAPTGHRRGARCAAPSRRLALRRFRAVAGRPEALRVHGPGSGQRQGEERAQRLPLHDDRTLHRARGVRTMGEALVGTVPREVIPDRPMERMLSSVANAIRLIKAFSEHDYEMGITTLATRLRLAKSTVHRLATTLVEYDMLEQNRETGKYRLGLALFELGTLVRRKMDAASESRDQMHALVEITGETVQLAVLDHLSVLYIRIRESSQA